MSPENPNRPAWRAVHRPLLGLLTGLAILALFELGLRLIGAGSDLHQRDPYLGFRPGSPLMVQDPRAPEGRMVTADWRIGQFNRQRLTLPRPGGTYRILCFGGSTVFGFPFWDPGSFSNFLRQGLSIADPFRQYEVINLGGMGYASYRVRWLVEEGLGYEPDLVVLMSGHNEFLEYRFYEQSVDQPESALALRGMLYKLRIFELLREAVLSVKESPQSIESGSWTMLPGDTLDRRPLVRDEIQREQTIEHFSYNIRQIIQACQNAQVPLIIATLPSNLKDYPPNLSEHGPDFSDANKGRLLELINQGLADLDAGELEPAISGLESAYELDPGYAAISFALGRSYLSAGHVDRAKKYFQQAADDDAMPIRAGLAVNESIRELAAADRVALADMESAFFRAAGDGIPGDELFLDHCHPGPAGQNIIALSIARVMAEQGWIKPRMDLLMAFDRAAADVVGSMDDDFLAESYYRLAFETGVHLGRTERGLRFLDLALSFNPNHAGAYVLMEKLGEK